MGEEEERGLAQGLANRSGTPGAYARASPGSATLCRKVIVKAATHGLLKAAKRTSAFLVSITMPGKLTRQAAFYFRPSKNIIGHVF